ncbi:MAG TPA: hypothetical protein VE219_05200, partial [Candidatus Sulfotelmatobacter sp.]|nr:hypothetical protein [Candidatus Sulfotelmatobacter sp.]
MGSSGTRQGDGLGVEVGGGGGGGGGGGAAVVAGVPSGRGAADVLAAGALVRPGLGTPPGVLSNGAAVGLPEVAWGEGVPGGSEGAVPGEMTPQAMPGPE